MHCRSLVLALALGLGACSQADSDRELPPLAAAENVYPNLNDVPARPQPNDSLKDRNEAAAALVTRRAQTTERVMPLRETIANRTGLPLSEIAGVAEEDVPADTMAADALPGSVTTAESVRVDNVSAVYVDALINLEQDRNGIDDLFEELVSSQISFANSDSQNRELALVQSQADAEIGRSINYNSIYQMLQTLRNPAPAATAPTPLTTP